MMRHMLLARIGLLACALAVMTIGASTLQAVSFTSGIPKWRESWVYFKIDPQFDQRLRNSVNGLGVPGATTNVRDSTLEWNNNTVFSFRETSWSSAGGGRIFVGDTDNGSIFLHPECRYPGGALAVSCGDPPNSTAPRWFNNIEMVIDTRPRFTSSVAAYTDGAGWVYNVYAVARHEFGHWIGFSHSSDPASTVYVGGGDKPVSEGDKRGVTMSYGLFTGFDEAATPAGITHPTSEAKYQQPEMKSGVVNFFGQAGTLPELGPVYPSNETAFGNVGLPPAAAGRIARFAGTATQTRSYVYLRLFTWDDDLNTSRKATTAIPDGTKLKWCQYNYWSGSGPKQDQISIDAQYFERDANGLIKKNASGQIIYKTLRDNLAIVDGGGLPIHPAARSDPRYPVNAWNCFTVDLTPLPDVGIVNWYIAYDNGNSGKTGPFRAYFDSVYLAFPGSTKQ